MIVNVQKTKMVQFKKGKTNANFTLNDEKIINCEQI